MKNIVVGVDCGATHTKAAVWRSGEKVWEKVDLPGVNLDVVGRAEAADLLLPHLEEIASFGSADWVVGIAGLDSEKERIEGEQWFRRILASSGASLTSLKVVSDVELVLWSGSPEGVGIALIAGTGSNCYGRNKSGKTVKVGGMSHLLSDEGSGFALGWHCLHIATKMSDSRVVETGLVRDVLKLYKKRDIVGLKNHLMDTANVKVEIARAAVPLLSAAERGERVAQVCVLAEISELVLMVATVNRKLSPIHHLPVFTAGSLFENNYFKNTFQNQLRSVFFDQLVQYVTPLDGALNMLT